jgi:integrase
MRARNKLNVKQVALLKRVGVHSDGGGLYLRVRETGSRSWLFIYTFGGTRREMGLGSDLDVSLAKAREKAADARELILDGKDPQATRAAAVTAATPQPLVTFGSFAMSWLDGVEEGFNNAKHRQQWRNTLKTYAAPLFPLAIDAVDTQAIKDVLMPIWLSKPETASRVRQRIERVLNSAKAQGLRDGDNPARFRGHLDEVLPNRSKKDVKHHAALPFKDVAVFMTELRNRPAMAARALEYTVLTAARSGEVRGMTWAEVDLENRLWTVPGVRMKAGNEHQVPLSDAAIALLNKIKPETIIADQLVFPAQRGGVMSDMAMSQLLKRMERGDITVHGFRSTFRDWAGETTEFGREEIEMALAHTIESAVERAYRRGRSIEKRRPLMAAWAAYCTVVSEGVGADPEAILTLALSIDA